MYIAPDPASRSRGACMTTIQENKLHLPINRFKPMRLLYYTLIIISCYISHYAMGIYCITESMRELKRHVHVYTQHNIWRIHTSRQIIKMIALHFKYKNQNSTLVS